LFSRELPSVKLSYFLRAVRGMAVALTTVLFFGNKAACTCGILMHVIRVIGRRQVTVWQIPIKKVSCGLMSACLFDGFVLLRDFPGRFRASSSYSPVGEFVTGCLATLWI
jgi:hypothetical protein